MQNVGFRIPFLGTYNYSGALQEKFCIFMMSLIYLPPAELGFTRFGTSQKCLLQALIFVNQDP
ncbi:hypothetical protein SAMN06269250_4590 [Spirosoma fluviale]|uniref:Uncharacterized protein n=1 Tax=Spirosoma fluviale TaxID=1597977 RepID=A0A286GF27_9BACT|nr:hypothetical protein SAMN06269250_4590 [Spirosoma fluviale]